MHSRIVWLFLLLALPSLGTAQTDDFKRLVQVKSLRCELSPGILTSWDSGRPKSHPDKYSGPITFDAIDTKTGTARLVATDGAADLTVVLSGLGLTFTEETAFGNLSITTVFADRVKGTDKFIVVQSRHMLTLSGPFMSQFNGTCKALQ